jgi:hypothetical protein
VTEYIGVSMDVTERKRDEAALQLAQAERARVARADDNRRAGGIDRARNQSTSVCHQHQLPCCAPLAGARGA